jgi:hypothetical protein
MDIIKSRQQLFKIIFDADTNTPISQRLKSFIEVLENSKFTDFSREIETLYQLEKRFLNNSYSILDVQDFENLLIEISELPVFKH